MYLISTAKTTVLTSFQDLDVKSTYQHSNGENTDFQFYTQQRIFVEVNKKSGLELMRIREKVNEGISIQRVRKLTIDNVYCVACAKQSVEEMAVGLSNGQVKLYNYKNSEFIHKFSADTNRNSVLYLDYNASDEYIAGVFECGLINIYGHKTKTKVDSFNIDGQSTLARFHPSKRFHLSIASYKGAVTLYDIQAKRKLFNASDAHAAPCRDLCISPGSPDTLISVGYDCLINIFDMRRKVKPLQINYCHPLSTVAVSECGTYFCAGNLKGEIITNDMRNLKSFLSSKKIHDCGVTRVAFAPTSADNSSYSTSSLVAATSDISLSGLGAKENELRKSLTSNAADGARCQRDSFCDFLDYQINRDQEKNSSRVLRSDSFDWESLSHKSHPDINRSFEHLTTNNDICDFKANTSDFLKLPLKDRNSASLHTNAGKLAQIKEEEKHLVDLEKYVDSGSEKENPQINDTNLSSNRLHAPIACNSTPNREHASMEDVLTATKPQGSSTTNNTPNNTPASLEDQAHCTTPVPDANVFKAISDLRQETLQRFHHLECELKFMIENNKWQIFTQNFNLWKQNIEQTENIRDWLAALLQTDPFVNELLRLKDENELLKQQLKDLLNK